MHASPAQHKGADSLEHAVSIYAESELSVARSSDLVLGAAPRQSR